MDISNVRLKIWPSLILPREYAINFPNDRLWITVWKSVSNELDTHILICVYVTLVQLYYALLNRWCYQASGRGY